MLNFFFSLMLYLTMNTFYLNYKNYFHGHSAYLPKNIISQHESSLWQPGCDSHTHTKRII